MAGCQGYVGGNLRDWDGWQGVGGELSLAQICPFPLGAPARQSGYATCRSRVSQRSRSQSPMKLKASTVRNIAMPGKNATHHEFAR